MLPEQKAPDSPASTSQHSNLSCIAPSQALFTVEAYTPLKAHLAILTENEIAPQLIRKPLSNVTIRSHAYIAKYDRQAKNGSRQAINGRVDLEEGIEASHLSPLSITMNGETYEYIPICGVPDYFKHVEESYDPREYLEPAVTDPRASEAPSKEPSIPSASSDPPFKKRTITIDLEGNDNDHSNHRSVSVLGKRKSQRAMGCPGEADRTVARESKFLRMQEQDITPGMEQHPVILIDDSDDSDEYGPGQSNAGNNSSSEDKSSSAGSALDRPILMILSDDDEDDDSEGKANPIFDRKQHYGQTSRAFSSTKKHISSAASQDQYGCSILSSVPSCRSPGEGYTDAPAASIADPTLSGCADAHCEPTGTISLTTNEGYVLSEEQLYVIDQVVTHRKSVFFTGSAGTGKSVLLGELIAQLQEREWKGKRAADSMGFTDTSIAGAIAVTASTGIAACNIGGCTLHSFAGIGLGNGTVDDLVKKVQAISAAELRWKQTKVLIVDEVSMISAELLDKLDALARLVRNDDRPWGGIQLVLCGDFFQLPPVNAINRISKADKATDLAGRTNRTLKTSKGKLDLEEGTCRFCFEANSWKTTIQKTIELRQVFRQKDREFVDMLNEVRVGRMSCATIEVFRSLERDIPDENGIVPAMLFPCRKEVDKSNRGMLSGIRSDSFVFMARDSGRLQNKMDELCIAPTKLEIKVGAQVMLLRNQGAASGGLVNGSIGIVTAFTTDPAQNNIRVGPEGGLPSLNDEGDLLPRVRFQNGREMVIGREEWTLELPGGIVLARRHQVPLCLAWALSIHKSQGQTLQKVQVDLGRVFETGQAYVALSRATSLEGLQVKNFRPGRVMVNPKVAAFYAQMHHVARDLS